MLSTDSTLPYFTFRTNLKDVLLQPSYRWRSGRLRCCHVDSEDSQCRQKPAVTAKLPRPYPPEHKFECKIHNWTSHTDWPRCTECTGWHTLHGMSF